MNKPDNFSVKNIKFLSKLHDNLEYLNKAGVHNDSGYSAITETIHMKKPMITMPINNHRTMVKCKKEDKNYGLLTNLSNLEENIMSSVLILWITEPH